MRPIHPPRKGRQMDDGDGCVLAVPTARKDAYRPHARDAARVFNQQRDAFQAAPAAAQPS
jgi:uncharacterized protein YbaA (DUF1428 family)